MSTTRTVVAGAGGLLALLLAWLLAASIVSADLLPRPALVMSRFWAGIESGELVRHAAETFSISLKILVVGVIVGAVAGLALGICTTCYEILRPFLAFFNAMPRLALAPIFILWFGTGDASKLALGASLVGFVVLFAVHAGVRDARPLLIDSVRSMGGNRQDILREVVLPGMLPYLLGTIPPSIALSWLAAVVGEMLVSSKGLGWLIRRDAYAGDLASMFSALAVLALLTLGTQMVIAQLQRLVAPWRE